MAIINYTDQIKYTGKGYLDAKMMPVNTYDDLKKIQMSQRFEGLTVVVLNNGNPQDYWLIGGITNSCWQPKTATSFEDLRIVLEDGFLKLTNAGVQLGDAVDFNEFFPSKPGTGSGDDLFIESVDYTTKDAAGKTGVFMCFTYSDGTKKYLDMSQFLSATYKAGSGIVIDGDVISLDEAVVGRITALENSIDTINAVLDEKADAVALDELSQAIIDEKNARETAISNMSTRIEEVAQEVTDINEIAPKVEELSQAVLDEKAIRESADNELFAAVESLNTNVRDVDSKITSANEEIENNKTDIATNKSELATLKERVNALSAAAEGSTPDGTTIGITNDEKKTLYVKILNKNGNLLTVDTDVETGESGLFVGIPIFDEDEE